MESMEEIFMRRFKLQFAVIAGVCLLLPLCAYGQEPEVIKVKGDGSGAKIAVWSVNKNLWADALAQKDHETALKHWKIVQEAARWLTENGYPGYEKDTKSMSWPWGDPPATGGSGGGGQPGSDSSDDQVQPITVDIYDWLEVKSDCCKPVEMSIDKSQTGYPAGLTTVDVTVRGRVVDQTGMPVRNAIVHLANAGKSATTNNQGEFSLPFFAQGFYPEDVSANFELVCSCISIEPVEVGFATILPDGAASNYFSIYNSCDTLVDVRMPKEPVIPKPGDGMKLGDGLTFKVRDCSGGHSSLGSFVQGGGEKAQLGPGGRCLIEVMWVPGKEMMLDRRVAIPTSTSIASKCNPKVRIVGSSTWGIQVTPRDLRYPGVVEVGGSEDLKLSITNLSMNDLTVQRITFAGPHQVDFSATISSSSKGQPGSGRDFLLKPGGVYTVTVRYSPKDDGVRLGTLIVRSNDPIAPRILVPLSGLAEHKPSPPGTTSTIRDVPGTPTAVQKKANTPAPAQPVKPPTPTPNPKPTGLPNTQTQTTSQSGPLKPSRQHDVIVMNDGSEMFVYSLNPLRDHGMVLQEGADIDFENGTMVFTNDSTRAAFAGDAEGSAVFVLDTNSLLNSGIYTVGTKKTLWARLENGALAFWKETRKLFSDSETGPINLDISTRHGKMTPEGTAFWLTYDEENAVTELTVFDGRVAFQPVGFDALPVWIEAGFEARATGTGFPQKSRPPLSAMGTPAVRQGDSGLSL